MGLREVLLISKPTGRLPSTLFRLEPSWEVLKMKKFMLLFTAWMLILAIGCSGSSGGAPPQTGPDYSTPVVFIPGLNWTGGSYYSIYSNFSAQGFPESKMNAILPPRTGSYSAGYFTGDTKYAWYTLLGLDAYNQANWEASGNTVYNLPELKAAIDDFLNQGYPQVDLVGHSNGGGLIRLFLGKYPGYASKIRNAVMLSGFANVNDAATVSDPVNLISGDSVVHYFNDVALVLPIGPHYYSISSEMDSNMINTNKYYYLNGAGPQNGLPFPFTNTVSAFATGVGSNYQVWNCDHGRILTKPETFSTLYTLLTGVVPNPAPLPPATLAIGGKIVLEYETAPYDGGATTAYNSTLTTGGKVEVYYYDPTTGVVDPTVRGTSIINTTDGSWQVASLDPTKYFKIVVTNFLPSQQSGGLNAESHYFLANQLIFNHRNLDFIAPRQVSANNAVGTVGIEVLNAYAFMTTAPMTVTGGGKTVTRNPDTFTGTIAGSNGSSYPMVTTDVLGLAVPSAFTVQNFSGNDFDAAMGGYPNPYVFNSALFANNEIITMTHNLNGAGDQKVQFSANDRSNNRRYFIVYLYPPAGYNPNPS
jgi:pimeloyl-ACP methyl ester carboxylesterase